MVWRGGAWSGPLNCLRVCLEEKEGRDAVLRPARCRRRRVRACRCQQPLACPSAGQEPGLPSPQPGAFPAVYTAPRQCPGLARKAACQLSDRSLPPAGEMRTSGVGSQDPRRGARLRPRAPCTPVCGTGSDRCIMERGSFLATCVVSPAALFLLKPVSPSVI